MTATIATAPRALVTYGCGGCEHRWSGISRAHCCSCHRTFTSSNLFDLHRRTVRGQGLCVNPAEIEGVLFGAGLWRSAREFTAAGAVFGKENV